VDEGIKGNISPIPIANARQILFPSGNGKCMTDLNFFVNY